MLSHTISILFFFDYQSRNSSKPKRKPTPSTLLLLVEKNIPEENSLFVKP